MSLRVELCGTPRVLKEEQPLALPPSNKTRALLAYLVMNPRSHRRAQLADLLWDVADDPRGGLRWCLSKLRPLLEADGRTRVIADRSSIRVDCSGLDVDAQQWLAVDSATADVEQLKALCRLPAGEFCEGLDLEDHFGFHSWCVGLRQDLSRRQADIHGRLVELLAHEPEAALPHARALCLLRPQDVTAHAQHVKLLLALGQPEQAKQQHQSARNLLRTQYPHSDLAPLDAALQPARPATEGPPTTPQSRGTSQQRIHFCRSRNGANIAYAEIAADNGDPQAPALVKVANWVSHLEHELRSPVWRHLLQALSRRRRLIRYDQRGNGLSDLRLEDVGGERQVEDLEAVMDAAGCERAPLLGMSQGCPIAIDYAVRHPERVSHLVLYGGFAQGWRFWGERAIEACTALGLTMKSGWGRHNPAFRQMWTSLFIPRAAPEAMDWFNEMQRVACTPQMAYALFLANGELDVAEKLSRVQCPTLVLHLERDAVVPFEHGKRLAAGIPGARFAPMVGDNHIPLESDPCFPQIIKEIETFLEPQPSS